MGPLYDQFRQQTYSGSILKPSSVLELPVRTFFLGVYLYEEPIWLLANNRCFLSAAHCKLQFDSSSEIKNDARSSNFR